MKKILLFTCFILSTLSAHAQNDEAFAEKFAAAWCKCTDKNVKKLLPALKQIATNAVRNPTTDTTVNFQPYYDYLEQNPSEKELESKATNKISMCMAKAFKSEVKQKIKENKDASTYLVVGILGNNKFISQKIKLNDMASFYYYVVFNKLIKQYNIPIERSKK